MVTEDPDWVDAARDLIGGRTVGAALDPVVVLSAQTSWV